MRYEILNAYGAVVNTIEASPDFMAVFDSYRLAAAQSVEAVSVLPRHISKLSFRARFTTAEKVTLEIASLDNPAAPMAARQQAAALRANLADQRDASFIDLDRADTRAGVQQLEAGGLLAAGRAVVILDAPVQPGERYVKGA